MILNQIHGWFSVQMLLAFFHSNPSKKFHLSCLVQSSSILGISNPVKPKHKQIISGWKARGAQHDCKCRSPVGSLQAHTRFAFCSSHQLQCSRGIGSAVSGEPWGHGTEGKAGVHATWTRPPTLCWLTSCTSQVGTGRFSCCSSKLLASYSHHQGASSPTMVP